MWAENHHSGFNVFIKCKRGGEPRVLAWMSCRKCGDFIRRRSVSPYCSIVWGQSWERKIDGGESWVGLSGQKKGRRVGETHKRQPIDVVLSRVVDASHCTAV